MIQEDKELLFKDLCTRLPYDTIVCDKNNPTSVGKLVSLDVQNKFATFEVDEQTGELYTCPTEFVIPYLRPMSSMTKDEQRYIWDTYRPSPLVANFEDAGDVSELLGYCIMNISKAHSFTDWLNAHHFDYRGLIEKGLALEAPEGMYN